MRRALIGLLLALAGCFSGGAVDGGPGDAASGDARPRLDASADASFADAAGPVDAGFADAAPAPDAAPLPDAASAPCGWSWCWESPRPQGNTLRVISGTSTASIWAAGETGAAAWWDGTDWRATDTGTTAAIHALLAVGDEAWAVGERGLVLRGMAGAWTPVARFTTADLFAIWGDFSGRFYAGGAGGVLFERFEGNWLSISSSTGVDLLDLHGSSLGNIWAAGPGTILRFDGARWTVAHRPATPVTTVAVVGPDDVWAGGDPMLHFDGTSWTEHPLPPYVRAPLDLAVFEDGSVWAVARYAFPGTYAPEAIVIRWDGARWVFWQGTFSGDARAIWGRSEDDLWLAGDRGALIHYFQGRVIDARGGAELGRSYRAHLVLPPGEIYAAGHERGRALVATYASRFWTTQVIDGETGISALGGNSPTDLWAATERSYLHFDGGSWSRLGGPSGRIEALWAHDEYEAWAVGARGLIERWDGTLWSEVPSGVSAEFYAVHGAARDDVWAVGSGGAIVHFDGESWTSEASPVTLDLYGVFGLPDGTAWAVGASGVVLHFDGRAWRVEPRVTTETLRAIWADERHAYAAGDRGVALHFDGVSWVLEETGTRQDLQAAGVTPEGAPLLLFERAILIRRFER